KQGWAFTQWMRGYFILMNHPDLHVNALGLFLVAFVTQNRKNDRPYRPSTCYKTSQEVVDWWKKTHHPENLNYTFASSAQGWSFSVISMHALKGLTFEIYLPDSPQSLRENPPSQESEALLRCLGMGEPFFKNEMAKPKCFQYNIETFNQGAVLRVVLDVAEQVLYEMVWPQLEHRDPIHQVHDEGFLPQ
ncbi:MAG: hypothetical protein K2X66_17235, partial [Cyanobacteria bacterium]|nr:hypothetical protein [Cyanobacteriota bacterium]